MKKIMFIAFLMPCAMLAMQQVVDDGYSSDMEEQDRPAFNDFVQRVSGTGIRPDEIFYYDEQRQLVAKAVYEDDEADRVSKVTLLMLCAELNPGRIPGLIADEQNPNAIIGRETALMKLVEEGNFLKQSVTAAFDALCNAGATWRRPSDVHVVLDTDDVDLEGGVDYQVHYSGNILHDAVSSWDTPAGLAKVRYLLDRPEAANYINDAAGVSGTPLHMARLWPETTRLLLGVAGVNVEQANEDGETPVHVALRSARGGLTDAVRVLVQEGGADVNAAAHDGSTPLMSFIRLGRFDEDLDLGWFIDLANLRARKDGGDTVLHVASKLLVGGTPFTQESKERKMRLLLAADPGLVAIANDAGQTPLDVLRHDDDEGTLRALLENALAGQGEAEEEGIDEVPGDEVDPFA